jgi:hypothetical protein
MAKHRETVVEALAVAALDREVLGRPSQERQRAVRDEVLPSARVVACDVDVCNNRPHRRGERTMGALAVGEYMRVGRPWGALARVPEDESSKWAW